MSQTLYFSLFYTILYADVYLYVNWLCGPGMSSSICFIVLSILFCQVSYSFNLNPIVESTFFSLLYHFKYRGLLTCKVAIWIENVVWAFYKMPSICLIALFVLFFQVSYLFDLTPIVNLAIFFSFHLIASLIGPAAPVNDKVADGLEILKKGGWGLAHNTQTSKLLPISIQLHSILNLTVN